MSSQLHLPSTALFSSEFLNKIQTVKEQLASKKSNLIFVADFDHTLTTMSSNQCHDSLCCNPLLPRDFHADYTAVMNTPMNDVGEWWIKCHDFVIRKANLTGSLFQEGLNSFEFQFRDHCHDVFHNLHTHNIPSFIVSAGVQNVIEEVMKLHALKDGPHIQFFTNRMLFGSDDRLQTFEPPEPVTVVSKHRLPLYLPDLFAETITVSTPSSGENGSLSHEKPRYDVAILLGDNEWDFSVLKELTYFTTIKIGFGKDDAKARFLMENAGCDLVLIGLEHDMRPVNDILEELLSLNSNG
jgi:hypothetical protein